MKKLLMLAIVVLLTLPSPPVQGQGGDTCDTEEVVTWIQERQTWRQESQAVLDAQGVSAQSALAQLADHLQQIEDLPRPECADEAMLWTYFLYTNLQHLLICAQVGDTACTTNVRDRLVDYRQRDEQLMSALASGVGLPATVLYPPTPVPVPTAVVGQRSNPVPPGTAHRFPGLGSLTVFSSNWRAGITGLAIVNIQFTCERPTDQLCDTSNFMLDVVGGGGNVYERQFETSIPEPTFGGLMNSDVYGGGTTQGYAGFLITGSENSLQMRVRIFLQDSEAFFKIG